MLHAGQRLLCVMVHPAGVGQYHSLCGKLRTVSRPRTCTLMLDGCHRAPPAAADSGASSVRHCRCATDHLFTMPLCVFAGVLLDGQGGSGIWAGYPELRQAIEHGGHVPAAVLQQQPALQLQRLPPIVHTPFRGPGLPWSAEDGS